MIHITAEIAIDERDIDLEFVRSSGPGGQNVNKVSTAVQLRFDLERAAGIPGEVKQRLRRLAGRRLSDQGVLIIQAQRFRSQERNRRDALERLIGLLREASRRPKARRATSPGPDALERLIGLLREASRRPKARRATSPGPGARERRLQAKRRRGRAKRERRERPEED